MNCQNWLSLWRGFLRKRAPHDRIKTLTMQAFELSLNNLRNESKANLPLGAEVKLAQAAAALKLKSQTGAATQEALMAEQKTAQILDELLGVKKEAPANVR